MLWLTEALDAHLRWLQRESRPSWAFLTAPEEPVRGEAGNAGARLFCPFLSFCLFFFIASESTLVQRLILTSSWGWNVMWVTDGVEWPTLLR
mmetsp:Transcript_60568/g.167864  ORF Transcript_60568/g.167864 Transcript_60568/m.167864 type:complete len:92 (+) Transcript_60568:2978-3253(+)